MNVSEATKPKYPDERKIRLPMKVWFYEAWISEAVYKFWCKIRGGKFEVRKKESDNACVLVTKRGFHLISNLLSRNLTITPRKLEAYQMSCPEKVPFGLGQTAYYSRFMKNNNCRFCGRCYEPQKDDKKIIGKFDEN
jgi:hypothetical protein